LQRQRINWEEVWGYGLLILAACFWGSAASLGKSLMRQGISTFMLMQVRAIFTALVLLIGILPFARQHLRIQPTDLWAFLLFAIPGLALVNASYYYAVRVLPVAIAVFIQFSAPVLVFLYGVVRKTEVASRAKIAALVLSMIGTFLMVRLQELGSQNLPWLGLISAFVSMLSYAFYLIISHDLSRKYSPWTMVVYGYGLAAVFWCVIQSPVSTAHALNEKNLWLLAIAFSVSSTLIPFTLFLMGLRRVTPTGAAIASTSETVTATLFAFLFLGETLVPIQVVGALCILSAILILIRKPAIVEEPV
jgi:drug/metabolite transporter (DMT)-like permease